MPRRLLFALLVLVAAPLALLGWLSASTYQTQQQHAREQLDALIQSRLAEIDRSLSQIFDGYSRQLESAVAGPANVIGACRKLELESPIVRAGFFVNDRGLLIYPPKPGSNDAERVMLYASLPAIIGSRPDLRPRETGNIAPAKSDSSEASGLLAEIVAGKARAAKSAKSRPSPSKTASTSSSAPPPTRSQKSVAQKPAAAERSALTMNDGRWQVWYMDEGIQLIYWIPRSDGAAAGLLLERARWIADMTAALPDSTPLDRSSRSPDSAPGFTALTDETKKVVYRWGRQWPPR